MPTFADTSRVRLAYVREVTPGTTPATPAMKEARITSTGMKPSVKTLKSNEIRSDRSKSTMTVVAREGGGPANIEWSPTSHDDLVEGAMASAWVKTPEISPVSSVAISGVYNVAGGGAAFLVGHLVKASGFTNAANNGYGRVSASSGTSVTTSIVTVAEAAPPAAAKIKVVGIRAAAAGSISAVVAGTRSIQVATTNPATLGIVPGMWFKAVGFTGSGGAANGWYRCASITGTGPWSIVVDRWPATMVADTAAAQTVDLKFADYVRNGTTKFFHTFERTHLDTGTYFYFRGCLIDSLSMKLEGEKEITGSFSVVAMDAPTPSASRVAGATDVGAPATEMFNSAASIGAIYDTGVQVTQPNNILQGLEVSIKQNARRRPVVGSLASQELGFGDHEVSGTLDAYFTDETRVAALINGTRFNVAAVIEDPITGDGYIVDLPNAGYSDFDSSVGGKSQDVMQKLPFEALRDPTLGYHLHVQKVIG